MTEPSRLPQSRLLRPALSGTWAPRVARDIRRRRAASGTRAGDRARRPARRRARRGDEHARAFDPEQRGTPRRTRAGSRSPNALARTSSGTPRIDGPSAHRAGLDADARPSRWISIPPRRAPRSRAAVDHDPADRWIRLRAPLKGRRWIVTVVLMWPIRPAGRTPASQQEHLHQDVGDANDRTGRRRG